MLNKKEAAGDLLKISLFGFIFLGLALAVRHGGHFPSFYVIRQWALAGGHSQAGAERLGSFFLFTAAGGFLISLGVPRIWVSAAAGAIYGLSWGIVVAFSASMLGALALYWMGKTLLSDIVQRRLSGKLAAWKDDLVHNAFWWVLQLRFFPLSNATLTSLICGSCRVPFNAYAGATLIGFIPFTVMFAAFGHGGFHGNLFQISLGFALFGATILLRKCLIHIQHGKNLARRRQ